MGIILSVDLRMYAIGKILEELGFSEMVKGKELVMQKETKIEYQETFAHDELPLFAERAFGSYLYENRWVSRTVKYEYIHIYRRPWQRFLVLDPSDDSIIIQKNAIEGIFPFLEFIKEHLPKYGKIEVTLYGNRREEVDKILESLSRILEIEISKEKLHYHSGRLSTSADFESFKS